MQTQEGKTRSLEIPQVSFGERSDWASKGTTIAKFERVCADSPDAVALAGIELSISYCDLNEMANALASRLSQEGAMDRAVPVPLLMDGGLELVVAILACMNAGYAFVPLDSRWPGERLSKLVEKLNSPVVLVQNAAMAELVKGHSCIVVDPRSRLANWQSGFRGEDEFERVSYGYFTSGSTGLPKCALNREKGLCNRFAVMQRRFPLRRGDSVLQNSRHVFDSALWQILWPLTVGATVVLPPSSKHLNLDATLELIEKFQVVMTDFVPSIFDLLVQRLRIDPSARSRVQSFRHVLVGGEAINPRAVFEFLDYVPAGRVVNTYGPTEASIGMVFHEVGEDDRARGEIPLGRPIDNTVLLILNESGSPVAPGEVGEGYVGGVGVGAGYWQQPEGTSRAFVDNPFSEIEGRHLYRTGDLLSWREDGNACFHGRLDEQLKIDGVRVEPGEVDACLQTFPGVTQARTVALQQGSVKRLVAFFSGQGVVVQELRQHLVKKLPASLHPSDLVWVETMPLNHNGKLDREKLQKIHQESRESGGQNQSIEIPQGELEEQVAQLFCELLSLPRVGRHQDFTALGGTSLQAMQLLLHLQNRFETKVTVSTFASSPTVASVAIAIDSRFRSPAEESHHQPIRLDGDIRAQSTYSSMKERVLLTGATGFIGAHLLESLAANFEVSCLVRASDPGLARKRLEQTAQKFGLKFDHAHIEPLCGDLADQGALTSASARQVLERGIDVVVHAAGVTNFLGDYASHAPVNVEGTQQALRFASKSRGGRFLFIGSASARNDAGASGYDRSKWMAESLVEQARTRGLQTTSYLVGEAMPDTRRGIANDKALAHALFQCAVVLGMVPHSLAEIDFTPINQIVSLVVADCKANDLNLPVQDVRWPYETTFADIVILLASVGLPLKIVSHRTFIQELERVCSVEGAPRECLVALSFLGEFSGSVSDVDPIANIFPTGGNFRSGLAAERGSGFARPGVSVKPISPSALKCYAERLAMRAKCIRQELDQANVVLTPRFVLPSRETALAPQVFSANPL